MNATDVIGTILESMTVNITGSLFLTLLSIFVFFIAIAVGFRLPIEITVPVVLPFVLVAMVTTSNFGAVIGATAIYLAFILAKNLPIK